MYIYIEMLYNVWDEKIKADMIHVLTSIQIVNWVYFKLCISLYIDRNIQKKYSDTGLYINSNTDPRLQYDAQQK